MLTTRQIINQAGELLKLRVRRNRHHYHNGNFTSYCVVGAAEHIAGKYYWHMEDVVVNLCKLVGANPSIEPSSLFVLWDNATDEEQDAIVEKMIAYTDDVHLQDQTPPSPA